MSLARVALYLKKLADPLSVVVVEANGFDRSGSVRGWSSVQVDGAKTNRPTSMARVDGGESVRIGTNAVGAGPDD